MLVWCSTSTQLARPRKIPARSKKKNSHQRCQWSAKNQKNWFWCKTRSNEVAVKISKPWWWGWPAIIIISDLSFQVFNREIICERCKILTSHCSSWRQYGTSPWAGTILAVGAWCLKLTQEGDFIQVQKGSWTHGHSLDTWSDDHGMRLSSE